MASEALLRAVDSYESYYKRKGIDHDLLSCYIDAVNTAYLSEHDIEYGKKISTRVKSILQESIRNAGYADFLDMESDCKQKRVMTAEVDYFYKVLWFEAPYLFSSYMLYLEKDREEKARFYSPKLPQLNKIGIIQAMQDLEDDKIDRLCISAPPSSGKTTLERFFSSWIIGKYIPDYSLFFSHNADITEMFYRSVLDITTDDSEYRFKDIFPTCKLESTNAKMQTLNFGKYKPYASLQCSSIGAKNAGKVRASRYLYCDDLIGGIEEALNPRTLEKIWQIYSVDLKQRKQNEQVKELIIMTRWSVRDVIGRISEIYADDPRTRILAIPDIDPVTGMSNFDYKFNGMSVEFFNDQALTMDDVSYRCLYKSEPIEREGLLYLEDQIRRYSELPAEEPDAILGICDTKTTGIDYMFLPVLYQYGEDYYLDDCICDDSTDFENQYTRITNIILQHNMQQLEFESNAGGSRIAYEIANRVKQQGGRCNITTKATETNKETRIIVNSDWVKRHVLFKLSENYKPKSDYGNMMSFLLSYSIKGKNSFDDVPDGMANFALFVAGKYRHKTAKIIRSPL